MKITLLLCIFLVAELTLAQVSPPETAQRTSREKYALIDDVQNLTLDRINAKISFLFLHDDTDGTIEGLQLNVKFHPNAIENSVFKGTAEVNTLDTDNFLRDGHLMWKKYFNEDEHPKIYLESKQVVDFDNNEFKVVGDLTIKGITKEIIVTFTYNKEELTLVGKTKINTADFDIKIHKAYDKNKLTVYFYLPFQNK
ncbi:YceI family protein [Aquimarina brevivitae]|uniref:Polyisoprenoid-binding protein YceI n=1 Tax=Aquimarina brevivitae TaxID=323412 RepID=A0A4Q7P380_9FLAO|nr:YceI family protein [Aquimarina brevivitae]RZS93828.1 polyisoprenoid-binding protein YceI [Aquimarina brevivitae]